MADNVALQANERGERGKNAARRLRASGMTPAVLYGDGDSTSLAVETRTLDYTLTHYGDNALYDIDPGSGSSTARGADPPPAPRPARREGPAPRPRPPRPRKRGGPRGRRPPRPRERPLGPRGLRAGE